MPPRRHATDPFEPFPLRFIPDHVRPGDIHSLDPIFQDLEERRLRSPADLERWIEDWSELAAFLSEEESRRHIDMTRATDDKEKERRHLEFQQVVLPHVKPRFQRLKRRFAGSPFRAKLDRRRYAVFARMIENEVEIYRDENVPLEAKDAELVTKWQQVSGAQTVMFEGEERTPPQMARFLEETDRGLRQRAWETLARRRLQDRDAIDALYDEMVRVRHQMARNAGFRNYRDYAWRWRARFDYTPDDCRRFHDAVEELVVPVLRRMHEKRRRELGVSPLRPWDLSVDPSGAKPLRPFAGVDQLVGGIRGVFRRISPDLAVLFEAIRARGNLDLASRKGKAPGGYQSTLDVQRVPFIFMNAAGLHRDVMTLLHEGGHAFHAVFARRDPLVWYRSAPTEFCEVASMGMEALGQKHLGVFYRKADLERARRQYFEDIFRIFPWIAAFDAFQHAVYLDPGHSREDRRRMWLDARARFKGGEDWTGYEEAHANQWHAQMHPFCVPFYYIEYAFAQAGALQVWTNARRDRASALDRYRKGLSLGGSRPLPELFRATGLKFGLDRRILKPLISAAAAEIA